MTILIGIPTYDDTIKCGVASMLLSESRQPRCPPYTVAFKQASLLAFAHNALLCLALNNRPEITHLLLMHADVVPAPGFLNILYDEMLRTEADVLGVVLAIKDAKGLTSTALLPDLGLADADGRREFRRRRLTIRESEQLPETFGLADLQALFGDASEHAALLVNTGLMLIDVTKPFAEKCHFEINDAIFQNDDGQFYADVEPEDWHFSRQAASAGARVFCTRKVKAIHAGRANFPNHGGWGEWEHDQVGPPSARQNGDGKHPTQEGGLSRENILQGTLSQPADAVVV